MNVCKQISTEKADRDEIIAVCFFNDTLSDLFGIIMCLHFFSRSYGQPVKDKGICNGDHQTIQQKRARRGSFYVSIFVFSVLLVI